MEGDSSCICLFKDKFKVCRLILSFQTVYVLVQSVICVDTFDSHPLFLLCLCIQFCVLWHLGQDTSVSPVLSRLGGEPYQCPSTTVVLRLSAPCTFFIICQNVKAFSLKRCISDNKHITVKIFFFGGGGVVLYLVHIHLLAIFLPESFTSLKEN